MGSKLSGHHDADVVVVGAGLVGSAIAWGLLESGLQVTILDGADLTFCASRANFGLAWVQGKGLGMPSYAHWTRLAADSWAVFAQTLLERTSIDVGYVRPGGFQLALSEQEMLTLKQHMELLNRQPGMEPQPYRALWGDDLRGMLPGVGHEVVGGTYSPLDGHVNSLRLFYALHRAIHLGGGSYFADCMVDYVEPRGDGFLLHSGDREIRARRLVLAAGLGNATLASQLGMEAPVRPSKGHIIVTEKAAPFLHYPTVTVRQADEGGIMIGESKQDRGFDIAVEPPVIGALAARAVRLFPAIRDLNVVRTWAGLRVMSPDGFPIYDQSKRYPGAFVVSCHSGVTLAPVHALRLAPSIAVGCLPPETADFRPVRFHVSQAA